LISNKDKQKVSLREKLIISSEAKWKSFFDIWILLLVGYSCFTSIYYVAFSAPTTTIHYIWHYTVEAFFWTDLLFNFF